MKVFVALLLIIGSVWGLGSGPYLPSGWRPQGPAFYLPTEIDKPSDRPLKLIQLDDTQTSGSDSFREYGPPKLVSPNTNAADSPVKETLFFETEASGSDALKEYGPPKLEEVFLNVNQGLPDVATEHAFFVEIKNEELKAFEEAVNVEANTEQVEEVKASEPQTTEKVINEETTELSNIQTTDDIQNLSENEHGEVVATVECEEDKKQEINIPTTYATEDVSIIPTSASEEINSPSVNVISEINTPTNIEEETLVPKSVTIEDIVETSNLALGETIAPAIDSESESATQKITTTEEIAPDSVELTTLTSEDNIAQTTDKTDITASTTINDQEISNEDVIVPSTVTVEETDISTTVRSVDFDLSSTPVEFVNTEAVGTEIVEPTTKVVVDVDVPVVFEEKTDIPPSTEEIVVPLSQQELVQNAVPLITVSVVESVNAGVNNIAEALVNLDIEAKQVEAIESLAENNTTSDTSGSLNESREGSLDYNPPGFAVYGPPQQEDLARLAAVQLTSDKDFENNEVRRRRFSPKFRSSKKH